MNRFAAVDGRERVHKAIFLDRDGTLIHDGHYLSDPGAVKVLPDVPEALKRACEQGFLLFLFTNQSGVGRGYFSLEDVYRVNARMEELIGFERPIFTDVCIAPEAPGQPVINRKPSPRFILEMVDRHGLSPRHCYMVGDSERDVLAGINAGVIPVALAPRQEDPPGNWPTLLHHKVSVFPDLLSFVRSLEGEEV